MKKTLLILCAAVMALASCTKALAPADNGQEAKEPAQIVFNLSVSHPDGGATKAVKSGWETGDAVFVFFSGQTAPAYLKLVFNGEEWESVPNDLALEEGETGTMTAVYLPFGSDATVVGEDGAYVFSETYYSYYLTDQQPYTVSDGEVSGCFAMKIPAGYVQFFVYVPSSYFDLPVELREPHLTPQGIASIAADGTITHTSIAHGAPLPGYVYQKEGAESDDWGFVFSGILAEEARNVKTDYHFTMVYNGWDGQYFKHAFSGKKFYRGEQEGRALRLPDGGWESIEDYKPIDLGCDVTVDGVTKRIYWADKNVGAESETARGTYFAWGETEKKNKAYSWSTYLWVDPDIKNETGITKYTYDDYKWHLYDERGNVIWYDADGNFIGDGKTVLDLEDDAANKQLGGIWRMPTLAEAKALLNTDNFTWEWTENYNGAGIFGCIVTSQVSGYTGNKIFLLSTGNARDAALPSHVKDEGNYWTSTLFTESSELACHISFGPTYSYWGMDDRCYGQTVRAVTE